jgi:ABC-type nitrate/sulfonate/bicarbonate transport system substrate-binding protein
VNWEKDVVQRTIEGAGDYPRVQLAFLLRRLEAHPDALPAIVAAIRDMGQWFARHADALEAEGRAGGAETVSLADARTEKRT